MSSNTNESDSYDEILDKIDCLQKNVAGLHESQSNSIEIMRKMLLEAIREIKDSLQRMNY